jgi:hypothetical protein
MPIDYRVDHQKHLVVARGRGVVTGEDIFGYQREVWSEADVEGYDELIDMRAVRRIDVPTPERMRELALLSSKSDSPSRPSKFAIVAPQELVYQLGQMYEAYRSLDARSTKKVGVFRSMKEALTFLGLDDISEAHSP